MTKAILRFIGKPHFLSGTATKGMVFVIFNNNNNNNDFIEEDTQLDKPSLPWGPLFIDGHTIFTYIA